MEWPLTTLCIVTPNTAVECDWSSIGCPHVARRKMLAGLTNLYGYENHKTVEPISDWTATWNEYGIMVDVMFDFAPLAELLSQIVPPDGGMFVCAGAVPPCSRIKLPRSSIGRSTHAKTCMMYPQLEYAASYASSIADVAGPDPDPGPGSPFLLGWFPEDDPALGKILESYESWPDSRCKAMLPSCPSPSDRSVELVLLGADEQAMGVFVGESSGIDLSAADLHRLLGDNVIMAEVDRPDFQEWFEYLSEDELSDWLPLDPARRTR